MKLTQELLVLVIIQYLEYYLPGHSTHFGNNAICKRLHTGSYHFCIKGRNKQLSRLCKSWQNIKQVSELNRQSVDKKRLLMFIKHERAFSAKNGKISCISVDSCYPFHQESLCFSHFISNSEECVRKYVRKKCIVG